jgi:Winged helix DNA-binding domain
MAVAERVLTLRELNRAALARQVLLARKRLSPTALIERLVGMQAQTPQAPYVGIWSRTTNFRRQTLERDVVAGSILRATVMRQTLHLVTRRDYGLIRAALSETNFPWESSQSKRLAPEIRALAADGPVTKADAIAYLQREHGLAGFPATRAWRGARVQAHLVHHPESALWRARADGRFVAVDEPEAHIPLEARAELLRRYLAAFGPSTKRDIGQWSMMHVPEISRALDGSSSFGIATSRAASCWTCPVGSSWTPRRPHQSCSCRSGTTRCSRGPIERGCSPSRTGSGSSA